MRCFLHWFRIAENKSMQNVFDCNVGLFTITFLILCAIVGKAKWSQEHPWWAVVVILVGTQLIGHTLGQPC